MDLINSLNQLLVIYSIKELSNELNVSVGTITRWLELNDIPKHY